MEDFADNFIKIYKFWTNESNLKSIVAHREKSECYGKLNTEQKIEIANGTLS